jgi:ribosomal protein S27E
MSTIKVKCIVCGKVLTSSKLSKHMAGHYR